MPAFMVKDRVVVAAASSLMNLVGREGTVLRHLPESFMTGPEMFEVQLDNLTLVPRVPFYPIELIHISNKEL